MRRYFPLLFFRPYRELRERSFQSQCHKVRDGIVHMELSSLLHAAGFQYGGALLNPPAMVQREYPRVLVNREQRFCDGDIIVLGTRPPLTEEGRRQLDRSGHEIERQVLERVSAVLTVCSRTRVELDAALGVSEEYRTLSFQEFNGASIRRRKGSESPSTVGYSMWFPAIRGRTRWGLFVAFGLGGAESALFAHLLRTRFAAPVQAMFTSAFPRFFMLEFSQPKQVPFPSMTYTTGEFQARILADCEIASVSG